MPVVRKIKSLLSKETTKIFETAFILMLPALLTKITGQFFSLIVASFYGASSAQSTLLEQFNLANTIPELLTSVLMVGALGTVIIPILITAKEEGEKAFYNVYSSIVNVTVLVFVVFATILIIFANGFIDLALHFTDNRINFTADEIMNIANMMRALILPQLVLGISVFITSGLNVYNRFILPQLSPLFYNLGRILVVFILVPVFEFSPWALVAGVYIGSFLHLIIQIPLFLKLNIQYKLSIDFGNKHLREILKLGLPRMAVLASDQIGLAVNNFLSTAFLGGLNALTFAKSIYLVIPSLFGYTFSYASYPTITKYYINKNYEELKILIRRIINEIIFLSLPFVVTLMILRVPLVRLFFGIIPGTSLSFNDTLQIAWILLFFSLGLTAITARWFVFSIFYASKDTLKPFLVSMVSLVSVIGLSVLFTNFLSHSPNFAISSIRFDLSYFLTRSELPNRVGVAGISLAMSVVYTIEFIVMLFVYNRTKLNIGLKKLFRDIGKKLFAAVIMAFFMYIVYKIWEGISFSLVDQRGGLTGSTALNMVILTTATVLPAFLIYYLICHMLKVRELKLLRKYLNPVFRIGGLSIREEEPSN